MTRLLFVITKSDVGGAQKWTKEQIDVCDTHFICYLATNQDGWLTESAQTENIFLNRLIEKRFSLKYLFLLSRYVNSNEIKIVVASSANAGIYARLLKILNPSLRISYVSHGWSAIYNGRKLATFYSFVEKLLSYLSDSILCISEYDYVRAVKKIGIRKNKLKQISNSIYPIFEGVSVVQPGRKKILCIARASSPKRIDLLITAVKDMDVDLHIVGGGDQLPYLRRIATKNVIFLGEIPGFSRFRDFDIFCLISDSEGLPLAGIEAMSCGLPLILSNVGGCSELVRGNGSLVSNDVASIKAAILENILHQKERGILSIHLYNQKFNLNENSEEYICYYNSI